MSCWSPSYMSLDMCVQNTYFEDRPSLETPPIPRYTAFYGEVAILMLIFSSYLKI